MRRMGLETWLFGDDGGEAKSTASASGAPRLPSKTGPSVGVSATAQKAAPQSRAHVPNAKRAPARTTTSAGAPPRILPRAKKTSRPAPRRTSGASDMPAQDELFPLSLKLRRIFRSQRLQWNRGRQAPTTKAPQERQNQLQGISSDSFKRLQGHVPFTLKEIVKDPKKLPYLLRWLSANDEDRHGHEQKSNYHLVLLFLLEIDQLQVVVEERRKEQALKIWNKYIDEASEFQISSTLEITKELEQLVRESIDCSAKVLDSFFPIQKLAYTRLTREELPLFLKSPEYIQMLVETENDTESVPMERILEQPRAAHYFLLFLMQSRQHFELYFWLHVEYVLKPLLQSEKLELFWRLASVLVRKAQDDSQAITVTTKNELQKAIENKRIDDKLVPPQPVAKGLFSRAQQEIFVMLRSTWFNRFMKSNLYKIALKDALIHLPEEESNDDALPKLQSRTFSALEYAALRLNGQGSPHGTAAGNEQQATRQQTEAIADDPMYSDRFSDDIDDDDDDLSSSASDSDDAHSDESEETDFSSMVLDLESIIRLTKLPQGLQVHYRPNFDPPTTPRMSERDTRQVVDTVILFAAGADVPTAANATDTLMLSEVEWSGRPRAQGEEDLTRRIKAFLVPDGRTIISRPHDVEDPPPIVFSFQQSGRDGFLCGCVYLSYERARMQDHDALRIFAARGLCILSRLPLVSTLRQILEQHVVASKDTNTVFDPDALRSLVLSETIDHKVILGSSPSHEPLLLRDSEWHGQRIDVSVLPLFQEFGSALALQILACALLECSVVFVSNQYSLLTLCAEATRCLLRPFSWCHVYAPVLPKVLLSYLQCPTPILVGLHSTYATRSDLPTSGLYVVADVDRRTLEFMGEQTVSWRRMGLQSAGTDRIFLPSAFEAVKWKIDRVLFPEQLQYDSIGGCTTEDDTNRTPRGYVTQEEQVRRLCADLLSSILSGHTEACLVVGDRKESVVIFDETLFLSTRDGEDVAFYQALMRTQCFSEIVSSHRMDLIDTMDEKPRVGTTTNRESSCNTIYV